MYVLLKYFNRAVYINIWALHGLQLQDVLTIHLSITVFETITILQNIFEILVNIQLLVSAIMLNNHIMIIYWSLLHSKV